MQCSRSSAFVKAQPYNIPTKCIVDVSLLCGKESLKALIWSQAPPKLRPSLDFVRVGRML